MDSRPKADPFAGLTPLLAALRQAPLPAVLFVSGDDDWIVAEAARRLTAVFCGAFSEGEVAPHEGTSEGVRQAVADAATVALFSSNRLVVLDATEALRTRKVTADELDALLEEAAEAGLSATPAAPASPGLRRAARKVRSLAVAAGIESSADPEDAAQRLAGRVKRADRAGDLARLLELTAEDGEGGEVSAAPLIEFAGRAAAGDNALLVHAVTPDADHGATVLLRRAGPYADLSVANDAGRLERLAALGVERAVERGALVDSEVFDILTDRGRLNAREFLADLDRLMDAASGERVTPDDALKLDNRKKEYGSDFVEAVTTRRFVDALRILERLLSAGDFTAFRPSGGREEAAPPRKGPRGEAAVFPILGLLAGELRRMLAVKAAFAERGLDAGRGRRVDYRTFADRVLPALKAPGAGAPPLPVDAQPYVLFKAHLAAQEWTVEELLHALAGLARVDRGAKSGTGAGFELMEAWLLSRVSL